MTSDESGGMFEGDSADMCTGKIPLVLMGGRAEGLARADPGARTPIGASGIIQNKQEEKDSRKEALRRMNAGLLSPSTKRKGKGRISPEFFSPGKRNNNVKNTLNYWEDQIIDSKLISESDILAESYDKHRWSWR